MSINETTFDPLGTATLSSDPLPPSLCKNCGAIADLGSEEPLFVYALGRIEPRIPSLSVEKEFAQAGGGSGFAGLSDGEAFQSIISERSNRYLVRELCWVLTIEGLETYLLRPTDSSDLDFLVSAVRPNPRGTDIDAVIGVRGPLSSPDMCNGLILPIVRFDRIYSFDIDGIITEIPRPDNVDDEAFETAAEETIHRIMQIADNAGNTDEHRALNYVAMRYPAIYNRVVSAHLDNASLTSVGAHPSRLSAARAVVDVVFTFTHRVTGVVDSSFVRVDVTEEYPFLVTRLAPYFYRD